MSILTDIRDRRQINPLVSLAIVITASMILMLISFFIFWGSSTKDIVQSLQQANQNYDGTPVVATGLDDDERLTAAELLYIRENLETETQKLTPELDFGGTELDQARIGF